MASADSYDPLTARPVVPENVESWVCDNGLVKIERTVSSRGKFGSWVENRFGLKKSARVNLDEQGTAFWKLVDGKRTLADIDNKLQKVLHIDARESRTAVLAFTRMLMERNLINLYVKAAPKAVQ